MRHPVGLILVVLLLLPFGLTVEGAVAAPPALDQRLPTDPRLVTGRLDNGFTYVIRPHPTAEKRIGIWLHVASGSLNEMESTRGIAHYLEHLAFNGSTNFPPGSLVPFFEQLGLTFGRDQNAFTSFDQTTYQILVPAGQPDTLDKALLFMSDVASRLDLAPEEIERERQIIVEEKRARASGSRRVQDYVLERLAPESTLGRRLPIGTEATIRSVTPADFREFYRRWYVPSNTTLIVVGDCDPADLVPRIATHFGGAPAVRRPAPLSVGVQATTGTRAIVATDPELTRGEVSFVRVTPPRPPSVTVRDHRRDVVESMGVWILARRLEAQAAAGRARFEDASAAAYQWAGAAHMATLRASGRPEAWRDMLADLGDATQRVRLHGVTPREVDDARTALLADARATVARDATAPIRSVLAAINQAVARRVPIVSPAQRLALLEQLLPGVSPAEVSTTITTVFDLSGVVVVATLPSATDDIPSEPELARVGRKAVDITPPAIAEAERPAALLARTPAAGRIVDTRTDAPTGVTSVWLDNGVRAHHRLMEQRKGDVILSVTLAGGTIEETAATRGLTEVASQAWSRPATSTLTSTDIRDLLVGQRVDISADVDDDAMTLTVRTTPTDLETAFQLVYLLLTDPVVEPVTLARWREARLQGIERRRLEPLLAVRHRAAEALAAPDEARMRPLERGDVMRITRDAAQAWLRDVLARAPIEAAIVGDVDESTARGLVTGYLGALPSRARIGPETLAGLRAVSRPPGAVRVAATIPTQTVQAAVLAGFRGADARDRLDARLLNVAARILSTRMHRSLRQERQLVYSIGAASRPAFAYPGFGLFAAMAPTEPARAQDLASAVEGMYAHFAKEGPTEAEVAVARRQLVSLVDEQLQRPEFWAGRLAVSEYRDQGPRDALEARETYERAEASAVHEAFSRYWSLDRTVTIVVVPAASPVPVTGDGAPRPSPVPAGTDGSPAPTGPPAR